MAFAITTFYYGFLNGFSAQSLYESWAISLYNVLFTGLPILCVAVFDQQNSRSQLLEYPELYERGRRSMDFTWFKYWLWLIKGMWEATIIMWFGVGACWHDAWSESGRTLGLSGMGNLIFTSLIYTVNLHMILITRTWTFWNHVGWYLSVLIWFPFIIILSLIPANSVVQADLAYWQAFNFMSTAVYWFTPIVTAVAAILPTAVWRYVMRNYVPANYQIIQEVGRIRRKKAEKKKPKKLTSKFLFKRNKDSSDQEYTGYAFSQSAGGLDLLVSLGMAPLPKAMKERIQKKREKKKSEKDEASAPVEPEELEEKSRHEDNDSSSSTESV